MFAIEKFHATRHDVVMTGGNTREVWQPCTVIGVDASGDEPRYIVEMRSKDGSFYLEKADLIRRSAP